MFNTHSLAAYSFANSGKATGGMWTHTFQKFDQLDLIKHEENMSRQKVHSVFLETIESSHGQEMAIKHFGKMLEEN